MSVKLAIEAALRLQTEVCNPIRLSDSSNLDFASSVTLITCIRQSIA